MSMPEHRERPALTRRQVQDIRLLLRQRDGRPRRWIDRIGEVLSYPPNPTGNPRRFRFGISLLLLAVLVIALYPVLPEDGRRDLFLGFAAVMVFIGAWQIDKAKSR